MIVLAVILSCVILLLLVWQILGALYNILAIILDLFKQ